MQISVEGHVPTSLRQLIEEQMDQVCVQTGPRGGLAESGEPELVPVHKLGRSTGTSAVAARAITSAVTTFIDDPQPPA